MGSIKRISNDLLYSLNQIYQDFYNQPFPCDYSVADDGLRWSISKLYDINLNMFDTHKAVFFKEYNRAFEPDQVFYIYEGDIKDREKFNSLGAMEGDYPDGYLLGIVDSKYRDKEYLKEHPVEFFNDWEQVASSYIKLVRPVTTIVNRYSQYVANLSYIFALNKCISIGLDLEPILAVYDIPLVNYAAKNPDKFANIVNTGLYVNIYNQILYTIMHEDPDNYGKADNENKNYEFHVFMYNCYVDEEQYIDEAAICLDAKTTKLQLDIDAEYIYTTNTHYVNDVFRNCKYKLFVHFSENHVYEVHIGRNEWTDAKINFIVDIEDLLFKEMAKY